MTATFPIKHLMAVSLSPVCRLSADVFERWTRFWAFARLRSHLSGLDASVVVLGMPELHGTKRITMGKRLHLYRALYLETQGAGQLSLGDDVVLSRGVHLVAFDRVDIGAGTMIGEYTSIRDANHRHGPALKLREAGHIAKPISIGRQVWIGRGVTVLPGVTIGDGAVVGANAVVTRDVPAHTVVAGVPAQPLHVIGATA